MSDFWTDHKIAELKRLWDAGPSCSEIAAAIGTTRNAVIGKVHRLGLAARGVTMTPDERQRRIEEREHTAAERRARHTENQRARRQRFRGEIVTQDMPPPPPPFVGSLNLPFGDLRHHSSSEPNQCRYIADGGPDYLSCGNETLPGESWCGHCRDIVYTSARAISEEERARRAAHWKKVLVSRTGQALKVEGEAA